MIKAKELFWDIKHGFWIAEAIPDLLFYRLFGVNAGTNTVCCEVFEKGHERILFFVESLEEAKAACQLHFQKMAESMVDMEHLIQIITDAVEFGFDAAQGRLWADEPESEQKEKMAAKEAFFKILEQERGMQ